MAINLNSRDKLALIIAGAVIILFAVFHFSLFPLIDRHKILKRQIPAAEINLEKMIFLNKEYTQIKSETNLSDHQHFQNGEFNLFSVLEQYAGEAGLKRHIAYMKPSFAEQTGTSLKLNMVEIKFETITMTELIKFLYRIETSEKKIHINRMSINKTSKPEGFINVVIQAETPVEH